MAKKSGAGGIILAAVVLAMVAVYFIWNMWRQQETAVREVLDRSGRRLQDIPAKTKITREMVTIDPLPEGTRH